MRLLTLAALLVAGPVFAGEPAAPVPVDTISDPGGALERSTNTFTAPAPEQAAETSASESTVAPQSTPPPAPSYGEAQDAASASGKLLRGRGGDPYSARPGAGVLIDGEGRRLEIIPVANPLRTTGTPSREPSRTSRSLDAWSGVLQTLAALGAAAALVLTTWLWRRRSL